MIRRYSAFLLAVLVGFSLPFACRAASPRDQLLRLVPERVGFCLVVQNLREQGDAFQQSPFFERLRRSRLGEAVVNAPEFDKLNEVNEHLRQYLDVDFRQLKDDILGDAVVLAYQPGPPGEPEKEQGLLLLWARDVPLLDRLINRLNSLQIQSDEIKEVEERTHDRQKYFCRIKANGEREFYYRTGPILAFSSQETAIQKAIELDRQAPPADRTDPPISRELRGLGADRGLASLWIDPRVFDAELQHKADHARGAEAAFLKNFLVYWKALDGVALNLDIAADLELKVAIRGNPLNLPAEAIKLFVEASRPSALWDGVPEDPLFAFAGRVDFAALRDVIGGFMTEEGRRSLKATLDGVGRATLGRSVTTEVLPLLGPDLGVCVTAPPADETDWFPHVTAALMVQPGPGDRKPPLDRAIYNVLNSFLLLGLLDHNTRNARPVTLQTDLQDKVEVKYLESEAFPPGLQPAMGLKDGYLLFASSPTAFKGFRAGAAGLPIGDVPMMRLSVRAWRAYLEQRKEALLAYAREQKGLTAEEAARRYDRLMTGLQLFDRVELNQRLDLASVTWTLRVRPAQPFRAQQKAP